MKKTALIVASLLIVSTGLLVILTSRDESNAALDTFAQCLAEKGVTMYGAEWCPHCQNEKRVLGKSFRYVPYIECPDNPQLCLDLGIQAYPIWVFPDPSTSSGQAVKKLEGEQGLQGLSAASGCPLPETD